MDPLSLLRPNDLARLLSLEASLLPGAILRLNRQPRYHNGLNAIVLSAELLELRQAAMEHKRPVPSKR